MKNVSPLICPICRNPLTAKGNSLVCTSAHSFDRASKGYVNLLTASDKHSKNPGDNIDMARARKSFLDKGYYDALAEALKDITLNMESQYRGRDTQPQDKKEVVFLDAGCGDGYYTDAIQRNFAENGLKNMVFGLDISKEAIRLAAGRNKSIQFLVASVFKLPFSNQGVDIILNAFAPSFNSEFKRVLKKDGFLITVIPGKKHLFELKSVLYETPYENDEKEPELISFIKQDQVHVEKALCIDRQEDLNDLLAMTPYFWKTSKEGIERARKLSGLKVTAEFIITTYSRHA